MEVCKHGYSIAQYNEILLVIGYKTHKQIHQVFKKLLPMEITKQAINFDADSKLMEFIDKKLSKLETFYDSIQSTEVLLKLEKTGQVQDKVAEIKVKVPGYTLVAKETSKSFEKSVDLGAASLRRQLLKYKSRKIK